MGRTNMVSNIKFEELKWPVSLVCKMSSGCMDLCTFFTIWDTDRALYNCRHPTIFSTLVIFCCTVFLISLSLVSKLKLNTQVLKYSKYSPKYSGTPWGTQILEYSMQYCLKYSYIEYFLAVKGLRSLKFLACHIWYGQNVVDASFKHSSHSFICCQKAQLNCCFFECGTLCSIRQSHQITIGHGTRNVV